MVEVFKILEFKLKKWSILKNIFTNITEIIDEIVIECNPEGLKFNALDRSHICFFNCVFPKKSFDEYYIDEILYLYIDLEELVQILKRGKSKDELIFKGNVSTYEIIFKNKNTRKFVITQIDMTDNSRDMPPMNFSVDFNLDYEFINDCLKDVDLFSDTLTITCDDETLRLSSNGVNGQIYTNEYQLDEYVGSCSASYTVSWLLRIFNTKLSSNELNIKMGDDYPILIEIEENGISVKYLLAPRLGQDEG